MDQSLRDVAYPLELADRYTAVGVIGRGGMGVVVRARDRVLNRDVAIKFVRADLGDSTGVGRLLREARALASISPRPPWSHTTGRHTRAPWNQLPPSALSASTIVKRMLARESAAATPRPQKPAPTMQNSPCAHAIASSEREPRERPSRRA